MIGAALRSLLWGSAASPWFGTAGVGTPLAATAARHLSGAGGTASAGAAAGASSGGGRGPADAGDDHSQAAGGSGGAPEAAPDPVRAAVAGEIAGLLARLGLSPGSQCVLGDGLAVVDVGVLVGDPPTQVAIDVETDAGGEGRGAAMARARLLSHLGWRSACVRAGDWRQLGGDPERQRRFLAAVIAAAVEGDGGGGGHGHGHVCGSGCSH